MVLKGNVSRRLRRSGSQLFLSVNINHIPVKSVVDISGAIIHVLPILRENSKLVSLDKIKRDEFAVEHVKKQQTVSGSNAMLVDFLYLVNP